MTAVAAGKGIDVEISTFEEWESAGRLHVIDRSVHAISRAVRLRASPPQRRWLRPDSPPGLGIADSVREVDSIEKLCVGVGEGNGLHLCDPFGSVDFLASILMDF